MADHAPALVVGIDPGLNGAVACVTLDRGDLVWVEDMPTVTKLQGKGRRVNASGVRLLLERALPAVRFVVVEHAQHRPPRRRGELVEAGAGSAFSFGQSAGIVVGVAAGMGLPMVEVKPEDWKRRLRLTGRDKGASRALATQTWPRMADRFVRVKDDGRAEAALIALDYFHRNARSGSLEALL